LLDSLLIIAWMLVGTAKFMWKRNMARQKFYGTIRWPPIVSITNLNPVSDFPDPYTAVIVVFVFFKRGTRLVVTTDKSSAVYPKPEP